MLQDRHWLFTEFPELYSEDENASYSQIPTEDINKEYPGSHASKRIMEVSSYLASTCLIKEGLELGRIFLNMSNEEFSAYVHLEY